MERTYEQRMGALAVAHGRRIAMANVKRRVRSQPSYQAGCGMVADLLVQMPPEVGALTVRKLLLSVRKMGEQRVWRLLNAAQVRSGDRRVRELTDRQRQIIVAELRRVGGAR